MTVEILIPQGSHIINSLNDFEKLKAIQDIFSEFKMMQTPTEFPSLAIPVSVTKNDRQYVLMFFVTLAKQVELEDGEMLTPEEEAQMLETEYDKFLKIYPEG